MNGMVAAPAADAGAAGVAGGHPGLCRRAGRAGIVCRHHRQPAAVARNASRLRAHYGVDEPFSAPVSALARRGRHRRPRHVLHVQGAGDAGSRPRPPAHPPAGGNRSRHHSVAGLRPGRGLGPQPLRLGRPRDHLLQPRPLRRARLLARRRADPGLQPRPGLVAPLPHAFGGGRRTRNVRLPARSPPPPDPARRSASDCWAQPAPPATSERPSSTSARPDSCSPHAPAVCRNGGSCGSTPSGRRCLPVVTIFGLSLPLLVSGSVVVETIFSWPGMGQVAFNAARARDVPLILGATLIGAAAVILGNLVSDVLYAVVDPRARRTQ